MCTAVKYSTVSLGEMFSTDKRETTILVREKVGLSKTYTRFQFKTCHSHFTVWDERTLPFFLCEENIDTSFIKASKSVDCGVCKWGGKEKMQKSV